MSRQGQYNYKGINAQTWAAMSLFLQYLRDPNFSHIHLEAPKFEDFNLVFKDGKKLICESKDWKRKFSFPHLKKVLSSLLHETVIGNKDEILIICTNLDPKLKESVENIKYWSKFISPIFKRKKFADQQIAVLDKVRFWTIQEKDNHLIIYSLFSELLDFWLPEDELESKADSILIKRIYEGSARGDIYRREDIFSEVNLIRENASKYSGYFDAERVKIEAQLQNLIEAIKNNRSPVWAPNQISALSSKPALMFFVLDRLKNSKVDNLSDWNDLWQLYKVYRFSFSLSNIFKNNLHTFKNKQYILRFFNENIGEIRRFYQHDFFNIDIVKITTKIVNEDKKFLAEAFSVVEKVLSTYQENIFYLKTPNNHILWEKEQICKLLKNIYENASDNLKNKVYKLIIENFNLIEDEGRFSHYSPKEIFEILKSWLMADIRKNLPILTKILSDQYEKFYQKFNRRLRFDGWEHMGGPTVFRGHNYVVSDRHFVSFTIGPALSEYYQKYKEKAWTFIHTACITKTSNVRKNRPDFLNRACIPIILERYKNSENISQAAFKILKEFILSRKGIPFKLDLIYQTIKGDTSFSQDKKWNLVEVSTKKYGMPVSIFVEEIVSQLAKNNHKKAKEELKNWIKNPKYYERSRFEVNIVQNIRAVLDSDFVYAVEIFENFINSDHFIHKYDSFEAYDVAELLHDILKKDPDRGLKILNNLKKEESLTQNQQITLGYSLFNSKGNDDSDSLELLEKIYAEFIKPLLDCFNNDIDNICQKITFKHTREAFVKFVGRLVHHKKIGDALSIIKIFINDPDPYLPGKDPSDIANTYNEHKRIERGEKPITITSVRGWCGWVLMKCSVLSGRDYIPIIIELIEKLTKDENYYVKHMASFALSQIAQNRLTVLPENRNILFFNDDTKNALIMAKRVEQIAFDLLSDISEASHNVQKALAKDIINIFDHIRALNEKDALKLLNTLMKFPEEVVADAAYLFIYYAEFRKYSFENWKWAMSGLYDDLSPDRFDDEKFKKLLLGIMNKLEPDARFQFAAQFEHMVRIPNPNEKDDKRMLKIAYKYLSYLSNDYGHELFRLIYSSIKEGMEGKRYPFAKWYSLFMKCLNKEKEFYDKNFTIARAEMYWWPSSYIEEILMLVYKQGSRKQFLDAFDIIISLPKELEIHDTDQVISLLKGFPKTNKRVADIFERLFQRNPSKYYELKTEWFGGIGQ